MVCNDTPGVPLKASMDRPTRITKINLSLSQLGSGVSTFSQDCRAGEGFQERQGKECHWKHQMFKSESALKTNKTSLCFHRWEDRGSERNNDSLNQPQIVGVWTPSPVLSWPQPTHMSSFCHNKPSVVCLSSSHASHLNPCDSTYVQPNYLWVMNADFSTPLRWPVLCPLPLMPSLPHPQPWGLHGKALPAGMTSLPPVPEGLYFVMMAHLSPLKDWELC